MKRMLFPLLALFAWAGSAVAAGPVPPLKFGGETWLLADEELGVGVSTRRYLRKDENLGNWTRMLILRQDLGSDPVAAASNLRRIVKAQNPDAQIRAMAREDGLEGLVDFLTWPPDQSRMDFNIFRYRIKREVPGLTIYQFIWRFDPRAVGPDHEARFKKLRQQWLDEMETVDFEPAVAPAHGDSKPAEIPLNPAKGKATPKRSGAY